MHRYFHKLWQGFLDSTHCIQGSKTNGMGTSEKYPKVYNLKVISFGNNISSVRQTFSIWNNESLWSFTTSKTNNWVSWDPYIQVILKRNNSNGNGKVKPWLYIFCNITVTGSPSKRQFSKYYSIFVTLRREEVNRYFQAIKHYPNLSAKLVILC